MRSPRLAGSVLSLLLACGPAGGPADGVGSDGGGPPGADDSCAEGPRRCDGQVLEVCQDGAYVPAETCEEACTPSLGCVHCVPGEGTCEGDSERVCRDDGSGYELRHCDPVQGLSCDPERGRCEGACSSAALGRSYIGCEYFPTATANSLIGTWDFAVIVSNTGGQAASVRIEGGMLPGAEVFEVPPGAVAVRRLAYDPDLRFCNSVLGDWCTVPQPYGTLVRGGAYHLRSTQPVTVYQFNPLDYVKGAGNQQSYSHSNDASLLLPTTSLRGNYVAASWPTWVNPDHVAYPGIVAITATRDDTEVTVVPSAPAQPGNLQAGAAHAVTLDRGDVLELASSGATADLTGTRVDASAPVQVIGGHFCTFIPSDMAACDHLEEAIFPVEALGTRYAVTAPRAAGRERAPTITRIIAAEGETRLTFDPPVAGAPTRIDGVGQFVELPAGDDDFLVTADRKILVVQYMLAEDVVGTGDPSMSQAVPADQWRLDYLFHAPANYEQSFVTVVAPEGAEVSLDGAAVTGWAPLGDSGLAVARRELRGDTGGDHHISGSAPFGISVYGYGRYTSYWYPGGLDLDLVVVD